MSTTQAQRGSPSVERTETSTGFVLRCPRGTAQMTVHPAGVFEGRYAGHAVEEFVPPVLAVLDPWVRGGHKLTLAVDAFEMTSYATGYRTAWTEWLWRNRSHLRAVHILFRSPIVEMGINLANRVIGGAITAHPNPGEFRRAVDLAVTEAGAKR